MQRKENETRMKTKCVYIETNAMPFRFGVLLLWSELQEKRTITHDELSFAETQNDVFVA